MKKYITIIKAPTLNDSFEEDRLSDRFSDKFSLLDRQSDRVSMPDSNIQLNRGSLDRLRSLNLQKIVKNLSLCGEEYFSNCSFSDHFSFYTMKDNKGILLSNPSITSLFKNDKDLQDFLQEQKSKIEQVILRRQERQVKIQRYKQKNRVWDRKITYQSRKKIADNRLRIKGRFISKIDMETISQLINCDDVLDMFDSKNNLSVEKLNNQTQVFRGVENLKAFSKRNILSTIHDEAEFNREQEVVKQRIRYGLPLWKLY